MLILGGPRTASLLLLLAALAAASPVQAQTCGFAKSEWVIDTGGLYCSGPIYAAEAAREKWPSGFCACGGSNMYYVACWGGYGGGVDGSCGFSCEAAVTETLCPVEGVTPTFEVPCDDCSPVRSGAGGPPAPPVAVGHPVSVVTGVVFLTHTDAQVGELTVSRTYNSGRLTSGRYGPFGPGWNSLLDRRARVVNSRTIEIRSADGFAQYYYDSNQDGTYEAAYPQSFEARLEAVSGGGFRRVTRTGEVDVYDAAGAIVSSADAAGAATNFDYDEKRRLVSVTRRGRSINVAYADASSRPAQLVGPAGTILATYTYTASGMLASVNHPDGGGYSYGYDGAGNMAWVADADGAIVERHEFWGNKALTSEINDGREKLTFTYNGGSTIVTDATGVATTYEYATVAHVPKITKITGPCPSCGGGAGAGARVWAYDAAGNIARYENEMRDQWNYTYDAQNQLLTETSPFAQVTTYSYYPDGRIQTRSGPDGSLTTYTYGSAGPLSVTEKVSASETRTTSMTYTPTGQVETVTDPRSKITTMGYNATGDLETVTDPMSHVTRFGYDPFGRRTTVQDALNHTTTTTYDTEGRVTRITQHDGTHTDFAYDRRGRRISVTDPAGRVTRYVYDIYGWLERTVDPAGGATSYGYDLMGRLTSLTDALGRTTRFVYDQGRLTQTIYPGTGSTTETYTYDAAGRMLTKTDRRGIVTTFDYDALGRLTTKSYSDGTPTATFTYDENGALGRLTSAANGTDTLHWTYDLAGQVRSEASTRNNSVVSYLYDAAGNRLSLSLGGQLFVSYSYDDASRLLAILRGASVFGFEYDNANRRTRLTYPNGVATTYTYDNLNRLTNIQAVLNGTATITSFGYTYDAAGNRLTKSTPEFTETYAYDPLYRLIGTDRTGTQTGLWRYAYDGVGNRTSAQTNNAVLESTHDERNQLLSSGTGGQMLWRGTLDEPGNVKFTSALANGQAARMLPGNVFEAALEMQPGTNSVQLRATDVNGNVTTKNYEVDVSGTGASYTYDPNGNLTQKVDGADTWGYEWDAENQLKRVTKNAAEVARFAYDPAGRRVEKVAGGVTTGYAYDAEDILKEAFGSAVRRYIHGGGTDEPLAVDQDSGLRFYHADALGSVVKVSDSTGAVSSSREYDAWGRVESGQNEPGYAFTGREWDPETRLFYYRARYFDPADGRFLSEDPAGEGVNFFVYVGNNPVRFLDPSGLMKITHRWRVGEPWPGGGKTFAESVRADPECTPTACGRWRLEFTVTLRIVIHPSRSCPDWSITHEAKHAVKYGANHMASLAPIQAAEARTYASEQNCRANAWLAMVEANANWRANEFNDQFHTPFVYWPCKYDSYE